MVHILGLDINTVSTGYCSIYNDTIESYGTLSGDPAALVDQLEVLFDLTTYEVVIESCKLGFKPGAFSTKVMVDLGALNKAVEVLLKDRHSCAVQVLNEKTVRKFFQLKRKIDVPDFFITKLSDPANFLKLSKKKQTDVADAYVLALYHYLHLDVTGMYYIPIIYFCQNFSSHFMNYVVVAYII